MSFKKIGRKILVILIFVVALLLATIGPKVVSMIPQGFWQIIAILVYVFIVFSGWFLLEKIYKNGKNNSQKP